MTANAIDEFKRQVGERACDLVEDGMTLGLGTGSTATYLLYGLAARLRDGRLRDISGVPTSARTAALARDLGIPLTTLTEHPALDLALDGADEIDPHIDVIKGLGAALLREKIVAAAARRFVIIGDSSKLVATLGDHTHVPVEVIPFGAGPCARKLALLGCVPVLRRLPNGYPLTTDEGNHILDCQFSPIADPAGLAAAISAITGVVEHGLFLGMAEAAIIAGPTGVTTITRQ